MTKNSEIEKIFFEIGSLLTALLQEATDHTNDWKKNPSHPVRKEIEERLKDLFVNEEKKLPYNLYELQEMLTKIFGGLPGLFNERKEIDEKLLNSLTNFLGAIEKVKSEAGEKEEIIVPTEESLYKFLKEGDSKENWLESELKKEKLKNAKLLKKLASFEAAERDGDDQLRQAEEEEQKKRDEIRTELASIINLLALSRTPTEEMLDDSRNRLKEIKNLLKDSGEDNELKIVKGVLYQIKLEKRRRKAKQRIVDALADKGVGLEKRIKVKEQELMRKYQDYSNIFEEMDNLEEIEEFEIDILKAIARQRKEYQTISEALSWGRETISDGDVEQAVKARKYLLNYRELQLKQKEIFDDYKFFLNFRAGEFHDLISELEFFINTDAQVLQPTK